jgi:hypothetical protein
VNAGELAHTASRSFVATSLTLARLRTKFPISSRYVLALYRKRPGEKLPGSEQLHNAGALSIQPLEGSRSRLRQTRGRLWELNPTRRGMRGLKAAEMGREDGLRNKDARIGAE